MVELLPDATPARSLLAIKTGDDAKTRVRAALAGHASAGGFDADDVEFLNREVRGFLQEGKSSARH